MVNAAQPRKTRGDVKGIKLQSAWQANQGRPLPVEFEWCERIIAPIGLNSELVSKFVSSHLKQNVGPYYKDWDEVAVHFKEQLWNVVQVLNLNLIYLELYIYILMVT